ncbi:hypothetical protein K2173_007906 [Erythroxylum novogranatense]|uniref:Uncharacterized protein n=1 Tax=Erythroxylum novogranatense TaxID=1862640 RepID=A0AAV8T6Z9_9ROSI|nr:hypothetical protein K2173_007906 [Erythroxylum novogranatense]
MDFYDKQTKGQLKLRACVSTVVEMLLAQWFFPPDILIPSGAFEPGPLDFSRLLGNFHGCFE